MHLLIQSQRRQTAAFSITPAYPLPFIHPMLKQSHIRSKSVYFICEQQWHKLVSACAQSGQCFVVRWLDTIIALAAYTKPRTWEELKLVADRQIIGQKFLMRRLSLQNQNVHRILATIPSFALIDISWHFINRNRTVIKDLCWRKLFIGSLQEVIGFISTMKPEGPH